MCVVGRKRMDPKGGPKPPIWYSKRALCPKEVVAAAPKRCLLMVHRVRLGGGSTPSVPAISRDDLLSTGIQSASEGWLVPSAMLIAGRAPNI
jgi:hypothetical protein